MYNPISDIYTNHYSFRSAMELEANNQLARYGLTKVEKEKVNIASVVKDYKTSLKQVKSFVIVVLYVIYI